MTTIEIIGYLASVIIAISMVMSSLLKLRIINLVGAILFAVYGFMLKAYPVGVLNTFIAIVDIYYLSRMFLKKEYFKVLYVRPNNYYLITLLEFYIEDIRKFYPNFSYKPEMNTVSFFILRNMQVAGVFLAHEIDKDKLFIGLDYAIPDYRDFKLGRYVYQSAAIFKEKGIRQLHSEVHSTTNKKYLKKMGFVETQYNGKECMIKSIE